MVLRNAWRRLGEWGLRPCAFVGRPHAWLARKREAIGLAAAIASDHHSFMVGRETGASRVLCEHPRQIESRRVRGKLRREQRSYLACAEDSRWYLKESERKNVHDASIEDAICSMYSAFGMVECGHSRSPLACRPSACRQLVRGTLYALAVCAVSTVSNGQW